MAAAAAADWPTAEVGSWVWIPLDAIVCRDGSTAGIGVRLQTTNDDAALMIYLQGGGACYDAESCQQNADAAPIAGANYPPSKFEEWVLASGNQGIFNTNDPTNPVSGWNHIYVPYCSGDLHGGLKENAMVEGVAELQTFVGYQNFGNILSFVVQHLNNPSDVLLAGASAGGFGVLINYPQVVTAFGGSGSRSVAALVDSAPIIPETSSIRTNCFQNKIRQTFNLQLPQDCPKCADPTQGGFLNLYDHLARTYPQGRYALASADADAAGVILYDKESKDCGGSGVNIISYRFAMYDLRDNHIGYDFATYLPSGLQHTLTQSNELFLERKYQGVSAAEWLGRMNEQLSGDGVPYHVPPANLPSDDDDKKCCFLFIFCGWPPCGFIGWLLGCCN